MTARQRELLAESGIDAEPQPSPDVNCVDEYGLMGTDLPTCYFASRVCR